MAASRPLIMARFARMGASRHESYGNDITPPSRSVAKVLPPRVSGKPRGAAPLGVFPPHSGVKSFTTSLRSGNVPLLKTGKWQNLTSLPCFKNDFPFLPDLGSQALEIGARMFPGTLEAPGSQFWAIFS